MLAVLRRPMTEERTTKEWVYNAVDGSTFGERRSWAKIRRHFCGFDSVLRRFVLRLPLRLTWRHH